jgi:hypothetical protein
MKKSTNTAPQFARLAGADPGAEAGADPGADAGADPGADAGAAPGATGVIAAPSRSICSDESAIRVPSVTPPSTT